jgi:hypothetical protein
MTTLDERDLINGIDADAEALISLKKAAKLPMLRRDGKHPNIASLYRWASPTGCRGARLETVCVGGTTCTSVDAVRRFLERLSNPTLKPGDPTPSTRARQIRRAEATLAAAGI